MNFIPTITIRDIFKHCCLHPRAYTYLRALKIYGHNIQLKSNADFVLNNTKISNICNWCGQEILKDEFDYFAGYWTPNLWKPVHRGCKTQCKTFEIIECQKMDKDCNDCKYFDRRSSIGKGISSGTCNKHNKTAIAYVNMARGLDCFEHRKEYESTV